MGLLRQLADDGQTVILITHATKNVMLCDLVAFLAKGGYVAYYGPPDQALGYFGVDDFDGIYEKVERDLSPAEWGARYRR
jgi:ABC-type multidrug transport system ATPase subunit